MHPRSHLLLRILCLAGVLLAFAPAKAQDVLAPKWVAFGRIRAGGPFALYSGDGTKFIVPILTPASGGFNVVRVSDGKVLAHEEGFNWTSPIFSADSAKIYYQAPSTGGPAIWEYNLATQSRTLLTGSVNIDYGQLVLSPDGHTIACGNGAGFTVFDLSTNSVVSSTAQSGIRSTPCFTAGGTKIVQPGPKVFDLAGNVLFTGPQFANQSYTELSTPDGSKFFELAGSTLTAYSSATYSVLWSRSVSTGSIQVSRDGNSLMFGEVLTGATWKVTSLSTADGSTLSGTIVSPRTVNLSSFPMISVDPNADEIAIGSESEPALERWTYNSSTGSGSFIAKMADGFYRSSLTPIRTMVGGVPIPALVSNEGDDQISFATTVRDAATGELLSRKKYRTDAFNTNKVYPLIYSQDGVYYMTLISTDEIGIFRSIDDSYVTGLASNKPINLGGWVSPTRLWFYPTVNGSNVNAVFYKFDGTTLVKNGGAVNKFAASPDGTRVADIGSVLTVHVKGIVNPVTISPLSSNPFKLVKFTDGNLLVVNEINANTSENTIRIFEVNTSAVLLHSYTDSTAGTYRQGTVSNSGLFYAFAAETLSGQDNRATGSIKVYRISDNTLVRQWDDQYLGRQITDLVFSVDDFVITWGATSGVVVAAVLPAVPVSVTISPASVRGGTSTTATITMNRVVNQDTVVHPSTTTGLVDVPASVTVPAGSSSATFPVTTHGVTSATAYPVRVTYNGVTVTSNLTLTPASVLTVTLDKTNIEGVGTVTGTITLNAPAGPGGLSVKVTSSRTASATVSPATVVIPADSTTGTFTVTTKYSNLDYLVTITAKTAHLNSTANLMIARLAKMTLSLDKTSITGGDTATLTITRAAAAPTGGLTYQLSSDSSSLIPPTQIVLPAGQVTASVTVNTLPVASSTAGTITLASGAQLQTISATVVPPTVTSLSSNPTDVTGNGSIDVTITLDGLAPSGFSVAGSSNAAAITVPASISIPAGQTSYVLTLPVKKVAADRTVTITIGGKTVTVTLHKP